MTLRLQEIKDWLIDISPTFDLSKLNYIQSDASSRKYLRLPTPDKSFIIMDTQPNQELDNFINIAQFLAKHKINVPEIIHCNRALGLVLLSDFGSQTYMQSLRNADQAFIDSLYLDAVATLIKIQRITNEPSLGIAEMDSAYINNRMSVFSTWYLQRHLELPLDSRTQEILTRMESLFTSVFQELPAVFVHVDYHSRNLMHVTANNPGVLDFQDALYGPPTYDLVSLFQDAYVTWPRSQVESWVDTYREMAITAGILPQISLAALLRNFDLVGLQRHIKNLGVFARLHHRDHKSNYLNDIPTLLEYINSTCARYSELHWLQDFITAEVLG